MADGSVVTDGTLEVAAPETGSDPACARGADPRPSAWPATPPRHRDALTASA